MAKASLLSAKQLGRIGLLASSLWERIDQGLVHEASLALRNKVESRLRIWGEVVSEGDPALFARRLAHDGLDIARARLLMGCVEVPATCEVPRWCAILNEVGQATSVLQDADGWQHPHNRFSFIENDSPLPFEELLLPFMVVARERLDAIGYDPLPNKALQIFERAFLEKLSQIAARVLTVEFRAFLASLQLSGTSYVKIESGKTLRVQYDSFVAKTYAEGWSPLFEEYCVMARLLATALLQWVDTVVEFAQRLTRDLSEIEQVFSHGAPTQGIAEIHAELSDPHHGGRTVISVTFGSGLKLVYKPKGLALERDYFRIAEWLNRFETSSLFRLLTILDCGNYGWVEFVEHRSCATEDEIRRYYHRAGAFLCLVYALNGIDFHYENLIADSEYPTPVDLETIYHHHIEPILDSKEPIDEMAERLRESVLATDLLPDPVKMNRQYFDISALARSDEEEGEYEVLTWKDINTDGMDYRYEKKRRKAGANLPLLKGKPISLDNYTEQILQGFREAYRLLQAYKDLLSSESGPLRALFACEARFIFRPTVFYMLLLKRAYHPDYLRDGVDLSLQLDALTRSLIKVEQKPNIWPLIRAEITALWQTDVPKFVARGDGNSLTLDSGKIIAGCFDESAWSRVRKKITTLNEEDLQWQMSLIVGSMEVRSANRWTDLAFAPVSSDDDRSSPPARNKELLDHAVSLARDIERKAFRLNSGDLGWMVLSYSPEAEQFALRPMEHDLYNGRAGVALFFAALEKTLPGSGFGALAHATLAPTRRWIMDASDQELTELGFGGYAGLSSIIYALTRIGGFLGDSDLIEDARFAASRMTQDHIDEDQILDAIGGSAGAILGLLACYAATGDAEVLAKAIACGWHLLGTRGRDRFGFRTWATLDNGHLTGFAHGAAGIAYALLKLYEATNEHQFYDAAKEAVDFEKHEFVAKEDNWPDYRGAGKSPVRGPKFGMAWCHGAPGIGLGRTGALDVMDIPDVRRDIDAAARSTRHIGLLRRDHLCCGNAGLMDTLCTAGERLHQPDWAREALQLAARTMARAQSNGEFAVAFKNGFFNPSLFQGTAGVGYQMLRLANPKEIPSVLLLA